MDNHEYTFAARTWGDTLLPYHRRWRETLLALSSSLLVSASAVAATPASVDAQGRIVVNGKPVFLHGVYHDSMDVSPPRYNADFRADAERIVEAGFDTIWVSLDPTYGQIVSDNLAYLHDQSVLVVSNFAPSSAASSLPTYVDVDALFSLSTGDDFNYSSDAISAEKIAEHRELVESHVPGVITIASGGAHPSLPLTGYGEVMDAMGLQCYPISNTAGNVPGGVAYELEMCDDMFTFARETLGDRYPILPTLQSFKWYSSQARYPTAQELRNMLYTTLQFNPAGILWYSYYDGVQLLGEDQPALWRELTSLTAEVNRLKPALLHGKYTKVVNPNDPYMKGTEGAWHAAYWETEDETYLIVTNTDRDTGKAVDFSLPDRTSLRPLFESTRYGNNLRYEDGRVRGTAQPDSVHVYVLSSGNAAKPRPPEHLCVEPCT